MYNSRYEASKAYFQRSVKDKFRNYDPKILFEMEFYFIPMIFGACTFEVGGDLILEWGFLKNHLVQMYEDIYICALQSKFIAQKEYVSFFEFIKKNQVTYAADLAQKIINHPKYTLIKEEGSFSRMYELYHHTLHKHRAYTLVETVFYGKGVFKDSIPTVVVPAVVDALITSVPVVVDAYTITDVPVVVDASTITDVPVVVGASTITDVPVVVDASTTTDAPVEKSFMQTWGWSILSGVGSCALLGLGVYYNYSTPGVMVG